jgi:hypothetical protein
MVSAMDPHRRNLGFRILVLKKIKVFVLISKISLKKLICNIILQHPDVLVLTNFDKILQ